MAIWGWGLRTEDEESLRGILEAVQARDGYLWIAMLLFKVGFWELRAFFFSPQHTASKSA